MSGPEEASVDHEIEIDAPPEEVFAYLVDAERMTRWLGLAVELDPRPGGAVLEHRVIVLEPDLDVGLPRLPDAVLVEPGPGGFRRPRPLRARRGSGSASGPGNVILGTMWISRSGRPSRLRVFVRSILRGSVPVRYQPGRRVGRAALTGGVLVSLLVGTMAGCGLAPDGRVTGRVLDRHTGQPLVGAQVQLEGASEGAVTDEDGVYRLTGIEPGTYTLVTELIGYGVNRTRGVQVRPDRTTRLDMDLLPQAVQVEESRAEPRARLMAAEGSQAAGPDRLVVREANVTVEVEDVEAAADRLRAVADSLDAHVQSFRRTESGRGAPRLHFDLRVPAARLDEALEAVRALGKVERLSVTGEDVTEQATDIEARLRHLRALEERFLGLLETRAGDLGEVLQVERELARVRGEIERWEARLAGLEDRAGRSLLQATLHEPYPLIGSDDDGLGRRALSALARAWDNFVTLVLLGIAGLGYLVPIGVVVGLVWWWVRRRGRRLGME